MQAKTVYELEIVARKDARAHAGRLSYSPWALALAISAAWGLLLAAIVGAAWAAGGWWALAAGLLVLPFPLAVSAWARAAWGVELARLGLASKLLALPEPPAEVAEPEPPAEPAQPEAAELRPGYDLGGRLVAPTGEPTAAAVALRDKCIEFVTNGNRRGGWSRSRIAEGKNKLMSGDDWSAASKELQRLGFFMRDGAGLSPARPVADILARLELAR